MVIVGEREEKSDMEFSNHNSAGARLVPVGRIAAVVLAAITLSGPLVAPLTSGAASSHTAKSLVISTIKTSKYGTILVSGTTVYTLTSNGTACTATCLKYWPEVLLAKGAKKATAGSGVSAAKLGTIKRAGGELQVTYGGKPLYWFFKDKAPGQVNGNLTDTWGKWSVVVTVKPSSGGSTITTSPGGGSTTTTSPGGGGVGF
jgi:predicted lipoprotein with Yx(FWY)xxD motif